MKKLIILFILVTIIGTGIAFADQPDGWGFGLYGGYRGHWDSDMDGGSNLAFSLKVPVVPVFWLIDLEIKKDYTALNVSGDYYFLYNTLVSDINLDWYLGAGAQVLMGFPDEGDMWLGLAARVPIGLSWKPLDFLEVFIEVTPTLGFWISPDVEFPAGGWGGGIGVRFWF